MLVVGLHGGSKRNHVDGVDPSAVGIKVHHDLQRSHLRVEGVSVFFCLLMIDLLHVEDFFPQLEKHVRPKNARYISFQALGSRQQKLPA